jgi:hypothetical protein
MPVVAVGWNSERFDGRNLALRLVALGYTHVYWYRGGREAWEVAGLPETEIAEHNYLTKRRRVSRLTLGELGIGTLLAFDICKGANTSP